MRVLLGVPSGGSVCEESGLASWLCSLKHTVDRIPSTQEGLNFNNLWATALEQCMYGKYDLFAIMHTDIAVVEDEPGLRWIDRVWEEMESVGADFISVPNAIKDHRGNTASGVGNPNYKWDPYKRFTTLELKKLPRTFSIADTDYPDKFLLHNEAMCMFDMRKPLWYIPDENMRVRCDFNVDEEITLENGHWVRKQETEDWRFSRMIAAMGARSFITTRIELIHYGRVGWSNKSEDIAFKNGDEDTAKYWRTNVEPPPKSDPATECSSPAAGERAGDPVQRHPVSGDGGGPFVRSYANA